MPDLDNNKSNESKLFLELVPCVRCRNAFMRRPGSNEKDICENCIRLEKRKQELEKDISEVQHKIELKIDKMRHEMSQNNKKFNKQYFVERIKKGSDVLTKSIELLKKIEETNDEKYIEEYQKLFDKIKKEYS